MRKYLERFFAFFTERDREGTSVEGDLYLQVSEVNQLIFANISGIVLILSGAHKAAGNIFCHITRKFLFVFERANKQTPIQEEWFCNRWYKVSICREKSTHGYRFRNQVLYLMMGRFLTR